MATSYSKSLANQGHSVSEDKSSATGATFLQGRDAAKKPMKGKKIKKSFKGKNREFAGHGFLDGRYIQGPLGHERTY